jgi:hypothetical protein
MSYDDYETFIRVCVVLSVMLLAVWGGLAIFG